MSVAARVDAVRGRIAAACRRSGREAGEVTLVAVAKTFPASAVADAARAGVTDVGENRVQEMLDKVELVGDLVRWHFVGHLQSNKAKDVVGVAALVHSLDRMSLAAELAKRAAAAGIVQRVLVEVNVAGESSKSGVALEDAPSLAQRAAALDALVVAGFMAIPPLPREAGDSRGYFRALRELRDRVAGDVPSATELSMGMTRDFEVAVEEGATIVRVGEAVFGHRGR